MKKYFFIILIFFLMPKIGMAADLEKIFYMSQLKEKEGIESLKKNADKIDIIAPQFYSIDKKLKLTGGLSEELKSIIKEHDLKVMPLVINTKFNQIAIHKLLISEKAQDALKKSLVKIAKKEKYIGWQFDFENINYKDKDRYSDFVEKAAKYFHKNKLILSVAVVPRSVDYEDTSFFKNWSGAFDYKRLAKALDFISFMTYDDPNSVGPVASLSFINSVLAYVKDKIPPEKLSFGIPLYYWGWSTDPFKRITTSGSYSKLSSIMGDFQHDKGYDASLGASWLRYFWQNKQYEIWYQDGKSFKNKLDIIDQNNFRGFSAWVLGVEDPSIWVELNN